MFGRDVLIRKPSWVAWQTRHVVSDSVRSEFVESLLCFPECQFHKMFICHITKLTGAGNIILLKDDAAGNPVQECDAITAEQGKKACSKK